MTTSQDGTSILKPEDEWSNAEDDEALGNSKALNVIFNGVDKNMCRLINTCIEPKEAWEIFKMHMRAHPKFLFQDCSFSHSPS